MGDEHRYREIFVPDSGALLDIYVFEVTPSHWQSLLNFLAANYALSYSEDGAVMPLPEFSTIWKTRLEKSVSLAALLPGVKICTYFFLDDQIELDLLPEDVDSREKAEVVFTLMRGIARLLHKEVFMVPEVSSVSLEELRNMAVCSCDPMTGAIIFREIC